MRLDAGCAAEALLTLVEISFSNLKKIWPEICQAY